MGRSVPQKTQTDAVICPRPRDIFYTEMTNHLRMIPTSIFWVQIFYLAFQSPSHL